MSTRKKDGRGRKAGSTSFAYVTVDVINKWIDDGIVAKREPICIGTKWMRSKNLGEVQTVMGSTEIKAPEKKKKVDLVIRDFTKKPTVEIGNDGVKVDGQTAVV